MRSASALTGLFLRITRYFAAGADLWYTGAAVARLLQHVRGGGTDAGSHPKQNCTFRHISDQPTG